MSHCHTTKILPPIILLLLTIPALVQATSPRLYNIEIIIFKYNTSKHFRSETWDTAWQVPDVTTSTHSLFKYPANEPVLASIGKNFVAVDGLQKNPKHRTDFKRLTKSKYRLSREAAKLRKSNHYSILAHYAWQQPGLGKNNGIKLRLRAGTQYQLQFPVDNTTLSNPSDTLAQKAVAYELDGTIKVEVGRFLHVYTDFLYLRPVEYVPTGKTLDADAEDGAPVQIIYDLHFADKQSPSAFLHGFNMKQHRRMRSKKLHHIDHPLLGMLVYAIRSSEAGN